MNLYAAYSERICNMQKDLIIQKTDEFLADINCAVDSKQYLNKLITELVYSGTCSNKLFKSRSIYTILKISLGRSERTILSDATKAIEDIILDEQTRKAMKAIGIKGDITVAKFLNAAAKKIHVLVESEKKSKGTWIG